MHQNIAALKDSRFPLSPGPNDFRPVPSRELDAWEGGLDDNCPGPMPRQVHSLEKLTFESFHVDLQEVDDFVVTALKDCLESRDLDFISSYLYPAGAQP